MNSFYNFDVLHFLYKFYVKNIDFVAVLDQMVDNTYDFSEFLFLNWYMCSLKGFSIFRIVFWLYTAAALAWHFENPNIGAYIFTRFNSGKHIVKKWKAVIGLAFPGKLLIRCNMSWISFSDCTYGKNFICVALPFSRK